MSRKFLWKPSNCREEDYKISTSRYRLKRHIKELYPEDKILFEEENQKRDHENFEIAIKIYLELYLQNFNSLNESGRVCIKLFLNLKIFREMRELIVSGSPSNLLSLRSKSSSFNSFNGLKI